MGLPTNSCAEPEIPSGDVLIIADDAHRSPHVTQVLALAQTLLQSSRRRVKMVLSTRPSGLPALRSALSRFFEPRQILELPPIEKLRKEEVRALASELLGPDYAHLRDWLVDLSIDTPLVTVVGARLIARGKLTSAAISNEAEFRQAVFNRFIEEFTTALPNSGFPWRKLVNLMAALSPTRARSERFLSASEAFLNIPRHEIAQAVDQLEVHGLLVRQDDRLRVAPDTLGDFLLEDACINSHGEATGYADAVFQSFRGYELPSLLSNLAELEWRLEQKNSPGRVLRGIWNRIEAEFQESDAVGRCGTLDALGGAAVFQPNGTLRIVRCAMDTEARPGLVLGSWEQTHRDVLEKLLPLLGTLAYHKEHTDEAVRRLFALTKVPSSNPADRSRTRVLLGLASYQVHKSIDFLSRLANIAAALAWEPGAFTGPFTPLDIADQLLHREVRHEDFDEFVFRIGSVELEYSAVVPVRQKALAVVEESLYAADPRRSGRAVKSFSSLLSSFAPIVGRCLTDEERRWQDEERLRGLDMIERRVRHEDTPMPLLRQIRNALRQHWPRHHSEQFNRRLREVADAIPDSEALSSFDAFCTPAYEWRFDVEDPLAHDQLAQSKLEVAVDRFSAAHPSVDDKLAALEKMARSAEEYGIDTSESAFSFLELLCRDSEFTRAFVEYVLSDPHPRLGFQIRVMLPRFRSLDPSHYERIGLACAARTTGDVAWGAAHGVCLGPTLELPTAQDSAIIAELARHPDPNVRNLAIKGAARLGRSPTFEQKAGTIIAGVDLAGSTHLANSVCEAFGVPGMPITALSRDQLRSILGQLVLIDRLDDQEHDVFFSRVGEWAPDLLFDFFFERLRRYGELRGGRGMGYAHWGNTPLRTYFTKAQSPGTIVDQLRNVRDFLACDALPKVWAAELFWVFGDAGGATQVVLEEWLNSGDPGKILLAKRLAEARADGEDHSIGADAGWTGA